MKLYSSLHTTWDKVRVDILSHAFLFCVFFLAGVTLPSIPLPAVNIDTLMNQSAYKLAKDTNALLLVPVALALAVLTYGLVMRTIGQALSTVIIAAFPPAAHNAFVGGAVLASDLVTLASLQKRIDFDEHDLSDMVSRLAVRYAAKEGGKLQELNMASQNRDASLYLGYAIVFSSCWIALFLCLPAGSEWKLRNSGAFWPVLAILLAFFLRSWIRMREFFLLLPGGLVTVLAFKARTDSDLSPTLAAAQPRLADIEARVSDLRLKALRQVAAPSLFGFVNWLIGSSRGAKEKRSTPSPFWLQRVYEEGQQFSESERKADYAAGWLESFGKYLFYRVAHAIVRLLLLLLGLLLYLAGINEWLQRVTARALEQQRLELGVTVRSTAALNADLEQTIAEFAAASQAAAQKLKNDSTS